MQNCVPHESSLNPLQELRAKLLAEAEHSARNNASVAMRWADLFSIEVPQVGSFSQNMGDNVRVH